MSRRPIGSASCLALLASLAFTLIHAADAAKWLTRRGRTFAHWALVPVSIRRTPEKPTPHLPEDPLLRKRQRQQLPGSERWAHSVSQSVSEPTCWTGQEPPSTLYPQTPNTPLGPPSPVQTLSGPPQRPDLQNMCWSYHRERGRKGEEERERETHLDAWGFCVLGQISGPASVPGRLTWLGEQGLEHFSNYSTGAKDW